MAASAAQRAEEGISMVDVVRAYFGGTEVTPDRLGAARRHPGPYALDVASVALGYLEAVTAPVADG